MNSLKMIQSSYYRHFLLPLSFESQTQRLLMRKVVDVLKETLDKKHQEHKESFQNWSEFENRGFKRPEYMRSWLIEEYGSAEDVLKLDTVNTPSEKVKSDRDARRSYLYQAINHPNDVLIKIHAASINPIDVRMCEGYGRQLFNFQRDAMLTSVGSLLRPFKTIQQQFLDREFPLILGRDFSGTVVDVGTRVFDLQVGDEVFGAPSLFKSGTFADYALVDFSEVVQKPATCSHIEAASFPYVGLTVVSALRDLVLKSKHPKHALVLGGSGGIGTFAIQYLQAYGFTVVTTCSTDGVHVCNRLGANCIDYKQEIVDEVVQEYGKFGIVFDPIGAASPEWAKHCLVKGGSYVTLRSPVMELSDKYGPLMGLTGSIATFAKKQLHNSDINIKWGFFKPNRTALLEIARIIDGGFIKPVVNSKNIFEFDELPKAFKVMSGGHTKGKIVLNVSGLPEVIHKPSIEKIIHL